MRLFAGHPRQWSLLAEQPELIPQASLARAELEEALKFLAPRMPGLALDGPPALGGVEGIYGIDALPLRWTPTPVTAPAGTGAP